jgi:hypothetical protein
MEALLDARAPKCGRCGKPIRAKEASKAKAKAKAEGASGGGGGGGGSSDDGEDDEGGLFFEVAVDCATVRMHPACYRQHREESAERCSVCAAPLLGKYYELSGGKMHEGCLERYREAQAPKCSECNRGIRSGGGFSGRFFAAAGGGKVHEECHHATGKSHRHK